MDIESFLTETEKRLSPIYSVKRLGSGKNKIFFSVNDDKFTLTKDKSWSPGLVKTIVEDGHMFPCVLEIRNDPPEYTEKDVEKLVDCIDNFFVTTSGLGLQFCLCNKIFAFRDFVEKELGIDVISFFAYLAEYSVSEQKIIFDLIGEKSGEKKEVIHFDIADGVEMKIEKKNETRIRINSSFECVNDIFEYLKNRYSKMKFVNVK